MIVLLFRANGLYDNPLDPAAFANYAASMATTLKDAPVAAYQIWNEPANFDVRRHYGGRWNGRGDALWVKQFSEMARQATLAIRRVEAVIIHNLEGPAWVYAMRQYPQDFSDIDGVALHPYTFRLPPESVPWGGVMCLLQTESLSRIRTEACCPICEFRRLTIHNPYWGISWEHGLPSSVSRPTQRLEIAANLRRSPNACRPLITRGH